MMLRDTGLSWKAIARCLNISTTTLSRRREEFGMNETHTDICDAALHTIVASLLSETPNAGEVYITGGLRSQGVHVQRWRIRNALNELDPIGRMFRRRTAIRRRVYSVRSPNSLWYSILKLKHCLETHVT